MSSFTENVNIDAEDDLDSIFNVIFNNTDSIECKIILCFMSYHITKNGLYLNKLYEKNLMGKYSFQIYRILKIVVPGIF